MTTSISTPVYLSRGRLATIVASRFVLNAIFRIAYPLVPFLAVHFGVSTEQATWIVTIQVLFGVVSPIGGWLGDRIGYRTTMLLGLSFVLIGVLIAALASSLVQLVAAYGLCGIGVSLYQPAMQAYVSALTPYHQRGRAVGLVELSWALAGMLAVPPLMWLVEAQRSLVGVFTIFAVALGIVTIATFRALPLETSSANATHSTPISFRVVLNNRSVLGLLAFVFLALAGVEVLFIAQAPWTTVQFGASLADLGTAAFVFGIGELGGSSASAIFTDRLGKRRAAIIGFSLTTLIYLALPVLSVNWVAYLVCYLFFALCVEFAIVATLTLASTVSTVGRATVMAFTVTAVQVSRAAASLIGVQVWELSSIYVNGILAAALTLMGVAVALRFVRETEQQAVG